VKESYWNRIIKSTKAIAEKNRQRDRGLDRYVGKLSRILWPWRESWFLVVVGCLCILDYASTYSALEISGNTGIYESGPLASWALETGGFALLFLVDIVAIGILSLIAAITRSLYLHFGLRGYGRAAFVFLLVPYVVITMIAIINNVLLTFR
jgi:hypothetical protein